MKTRPENLAGQDMSLARLGEKQPSAARDVAEVPYLARGTKKRTRVLVRLDTNCPRSATRMQVGNRNAKLQH